MPLSSLAVLARAERVCESRRLKGSYHSSRTPIRNERDPDESRLDTLPIAEMTPTCACDVMVTPGLSQFGWLKKLVAVISQRSLNRSPRSNRLVRPVFTMLDP